MSEQILKIGHYILLEKLATGGTSEIYLAKMIASDKLVAIKKILPQHVETPEFLKLFKAEVKVFLNLKHGNIVGFMDCDQEHGQSYLVMELVNGLNLGQIVDDLKLKKTKFNLAQGLFIVSEVASGLDYAHRSVDSLTNKKLQVIHRDINLHHIMIAFDGGVKIIDFGGGQYVTSGKARAAPVDARVDIYALGLVLRELLTGTSPVLPVELERIVRKALKNDLEKRFQKISDLKFEVDQYLHAHFPEFRPADFADFVGHMYADVIKSRIEKLVYFSKVRFGPEMILVSPPAAPVRKGEQSIETNTQVELPEGFESRGSLQNQEHLNFEELKKENPFATDVKVHTKQKASQFFSNLNSIEAEERATSRKHNFLENSVLGNFKHLAMMLIVFYAGYSFFKHYIPGDTSSFFADQSSLARSGVSADATVGLPASASYSVRVKGDEFSSAVYKKLKDSDRLSYANVYVKNGGSDDTKIFVDGKLLYEKSPIRKLPIYANKMTTITAYDSRKNTYDEKKVIVQPGETAKVYLFLRPYKAP